MKSKLTKISKMIITLSFTMFLFVSNTFAEETTVVNCGDNILGIPIGAAKIIHSGYLIIKIATPIVLIVLGMVDFLRAVIGADESEIKKKQQRFIKRVISAIMVFLVLSLFQFVFSILTKAGFADVTGCIDSIINGKFE